MHFQHLRISGFLALAALIASACAGTTIGAGPNGELLGDRELIVGGTSETSDDDALPFDDTQTDGADSADNAVEGDPEQRGTVSMARATWSTGAMQAEVYAQLLEELGYAVDRGTALSPEEFYPALAAGEYDLWANTWPLVQASFFDQPTGDGGTIGDSVEFVGAQMLDGGLQGFLVDTATASRLDITTLDDIATNPEIRAEFDSDGDGLAEIAGCDEGWGCAGVIDTLIESNGWTDVLVQIKGVHGDLFAEQVQRAQDGRPVLAYVWTPGPFITQLVPGENAIWLGVRNPGPGQSVPVDLPEDQCGLSPCTMGFSPSDIVVAANSDFLAAEPAATALLKQVKISVLDVSFQNVKMLAGENTPEDIARHASEWIASHRTDIDRWLGTARSAG